MQRGVFQHIIRPVKRHPDFCETQMFIAVSKKGPPLDHILNHINLFHILKYYVRKTLVITNVNLRLSNPGMFLESVCNFRFPNAYCILMI
jgi:hypothetical protein